VEEDEKVPDWLADEAVVLCMRLPLTVATVPDAEFVNENEALPEPPATSLSSASVSSMKISTLALLMKLMVGCERGSERLENSAQVPNLATSG
jgi:hypothetical protein